MIKTVLLENIESEAAFHVAEELADKYGCKVYAVRAKEEPLPENVIGIKIDEIERALEGVALDLLVLPIRDLPEDDPIGGTHDYEGLTELLTCQTTSSMTMVDRVRPLLEKSNFKRIALLTKEEASINYTQSSQDFGRHMMMAAMNMQMKIIFNRLRPAGFTFRCYAEGDHTPGISAAKYFLMNFTYDPDDAYIHCEENRLVMRNGLMQEIPW